MRSRLALIAALALTLPASSRAQPDSALRIRAARRDTIRASSTATAAFTVWNARDARVDVLPHADVPKDWSVLMGGSMLSVAGHSSEMFMLSLVVPSRAPAGLYPIRVWLTTSSDPNGVMDSVVVMVPRRRALEVTLQDRPGFVVSGRNYDVSFSVRNRGNLATPVKLTLRGSLSTPTLADTVVTLAAEETRVIRASAITRPGLQSASDDVLELTAEQPGDTALPTTASARVTIVPEPTRKIEEFLKLPARVNLRASNGGVSPFEVTGAGIVYDGSAIRTDFLFRGKPGDFAAFGERDEYRLQLTAPGWRARFGDHFFMLSPLTGGSQPGFGAGIDATHGRLSAGGYGQQFRRDPLGGTESGAFVGAELLEGARIAVNGVTRAGGLMPATVASASAALQREHLHGDVEVARSSAASTGAGSGMARAARVGTNASRYSLDLGHSWADTSFAGAQRAARHDYMSGSVTATDFLGFGVNASRHTSDLGRATGVPYVETLDVGLVSATLLDQYTLELSAITRGTTVSGVASEGTQHAARVRADVDVPFAAALSLEAEGGRASEPLVAPRVFSDVTVSVRRGLRDGSVSAWAQRYSGGSITKGTAGSNTFGADVSARVRQAMTVTVMGYTTKPDIVGQTWHSQVDALASYAMHNGSSFTLRTRIMAGGNARSSDQSAAFLEYGLPLRLPISRLRTPGRVHGRVVDAVTGSGVPGALVRLGPQVAITDSRGGVAFGGVPAGEHRLSMSQETSFADAVFVGDPTLMVDSTRTQPTTFRLAIARSARVNIAVRRYAARQTAVTATSTDSLVDAGPLANATLVLTGERDTLYRTTGENGTATFTDVPPGTWMLAIRGDAPAYHRFDPDRLELALQPGQTKELSFRLVPRKREVQIIGDGQELKSTASDHKGQQHGVGTRIVKPNEKQNDR